MPRILVYALLGPAVGVAIVLALFEPLLLGGVEPAPSDAFMQLTFRLLLMVAYPLGLLPAVAVGLINRHLLRRNWQPATRLPAIIAAGALLGGIAGLIPGPTMLLTALAGASAALACALVSGRVSPA